MEQRSFMHNVELYNTIYIGCALRDEEGKVYARENEFISGKRNLVITLEQYRIVNRVMGKLLRDQKKRYRAVLRYNKKNEN
jgi:hypothetical protein